MGGRARLREHWQRVKEVFGEALALQGEARTRYLDRACADDDELRREVTGMLAGADVDDEFLLPPEGDPLAEDTLELPRMLGDDLELRRRVAAGGMGVVFEGHQLSLDRRVAVKVQARSAMLTNAQVERFLREAKAAAGIEHPNVAPIYEVGHEGSLYFYAMKFIDGHDLAVEIALQRGEDRAPGDGPAPARFLPAHDAPQYIAAVAAIGKQLAEALQAAHGRGIVHRDVKPNNVLLDAAGVPYLVDFGQAKDLAAGHMTRTGEQGGTPYYMSPEQVAAGATAVDHRTDVYSLGVVLYECLALHRPFQHDQIHRLFHAIEHAEPLRLRKRNPRVPRDLETICHAAMAKAPQARYATAGDLARDLGRFLDHEAIHARPPGAAERALRFLRVHWLLLSVAAALLVLPLVGLRIGAERSRVRERQALVDQLLAVDALPEPEVHELKDAKRLLGMLQEGRPLDGEAVVRASLEAKIEDGIAERVDVARRTLKSDTEEERLKNSGEIFRGWNAAAEVLVLDPTNEEMRMLAAGSSVLPRVTVRGPYENAVVHLTEIRLGDGKASAPTKLGPLPVEDVVVPPGLYRVVVVIDGYGYGEFTRFLNEPGRTLVVDAVVRETRSVVADMVRFPAGEFLFGADESQDLEPAPPERRELGAFYCDPTEVSNAEFAAFVQETGYEMKPWRTALLLGGPADHPVTNISWIEMRAFAEWSGKRLISHLEWERVARGTDGRFFPWGNDADGPPRGNIERAATPLPEGPGRQEAIADRFVSVTSHPDARTPEGIYHLLGNAMELTETPYEGRRLDSGEWLLSSHIVAKGGAADVRRVHPRIPKRPGLAQVFFHPIVALDVNYGFRCAKSEWP